MVQEEGASLDEAQAHSGAALFHCPAVSSLGSCPLVARTRVSPLGPFDHFDTSSICALFDTPHILHLALQGFDRKSVKFTIDGQNVNNDDTPVSVRVVTVICTTRSTSTMRLISTAGRAIVGPCMFECVSRSPITELQRKYTQSRSPQITHALRHSYSIHALLHSRTNLRSLTWKITTASMCTWHSQAGGCKRCCVRERPRCAHPSTATTFSSPNGNTEFAACSISL
jgi:hypothetical protein